MWYQYIAFGTDEILISEQMIPASIAKPWKEKTDKIIPQIIKVTHAASRILLPIYKKVMTESAGN